MNRLLDTRDDVKNFMIAGDQTIIGFSEQSDLYMKLITEELIHEFLKEYDKKDLVGMADGIADSIVVLEGFCHSLNLDLKNIWKFVYEYVLLNKDSFVCDGIDTYIHSILNQYNDLRYNYSFYKRNTTDANLDNSMSSVLSSHVSYIIRHLLIVSKYFNIPIQEVWDEVARSNNSKISENGKVIKNEFGKIQKPDTFSPADIESVLNKHGLL